MRFAKLWTLVVVFSATRLWADVSFITAFRFEPGAGMPAAAMESMTRSMPAMPVVRTRVKGTRWMSRAGGLDMIFDTVTQEVTLLDAASKTFAASPMAEYAASIGKHLPAMPSVPPEVEQMMSAIQMDARKTDRTDVVQGIKVGEREITMSMKLPLPPMPSGDGPAPTTPPSMEMKMLIHLWTALPSEGDRVPAVRELDAVMSKSKGTGQDLIQQLGAMFPFAGSSMKKLLDEFSKEQGYPLRTQMELSMPGLAEMMAQVGPPGGSRGAEAPRGPFMTMVMEITDLSTEPIDEAVFQVPKDYKAAPFGDLMKKVGK